MPNTVTFTFEGETLRFRASGGDDHILKLMQRLGTFYEYDVLQRIRERLRARTHSGAAVDAGGFIGTHSVFFAKFCGTRPVLTFEANPLTFDVLRDNLRANEVSDAVVAVNSALGSVVGDAHVISGPAANLGMTKVGAGSGSGVAVPLTTIDAEVERAGLTDVALIKVDVEGAELDVLDGARCVLSKYRPLLCVEVHDTDGLSRVLSKISKAGYWIVDCLGYSPTYIIESVEASPVRRALVNALWLRWAALPQSRTRTRRILKGVAQLVSGRTWSAPNVAEQRGSPGRSSAVG